ncbi:MAG: SRPBCC family protein [Bacteroidota bacterium]
MKYVKGFFVALIGIFALLLIVALFAPRNYRVERQITISKPVEEVFAHVKYLRNQDKFSTWLKMDPNVDVEYRGTDATVGFVSAWKSENKNIGSGEQEITGIVEGERIDYELRFLEPFESTNEAYMITRPAGADQTIVTWGFYGGMDYPTNITLLFMNMDEMLGDDLDQGLQNLKQILEDQ